MLILNPKGNYSFIKGIAPYSGGSVAENGYEIVHVRFLHPVPLNTGFDRVREHLASVKRPVHALCGMELRSPRPFTFGGFADFNRSYIDVLQKWGVIENGINPIARTNVAPEIYEVSSPSLYGFSYTAPSAAKMKTFVVAGGGELPEGSLDPHDVVRRGETSADALQQKAAFVIGLMAGRLKQLGASWKTVTGVNVYTVHRICAMIQDTILRPIGSSAIHGIIWHFSRPPIVSIEYEMDLRGCEREIVI